MIEFQYTTSPGNSNFEKNREFGTVENSDYLPFYTLLSMFQFLDCPLDGDFIFYPIKCPSRLQTSTSNDMVRDLKNFRRGRFYNNKRKGEKVNLKSLFGTVFDKNEEILLLITYNTKGKLLTREEWLDFKNLLTSGNNPNTQHKRIWEKFHIFVSPEFLTNPLYDLIFKKINKELLIPLTKVGSAVEIVKNSTILDKVFNNGIDFNLTSVDEVENFLNNTAPEMLFNSLSEFQRQENSVSDMPF